MIGRQANKLFNKSKPRFFSTSALATQGAAPSGIQTLWQYSEKAAAVEAEKEAGEAAYLDTLKSYSTVPGAYTKLEETGSSKHLTNIRKRINKIVQ